MSRILEMSVHAVETSILRSQSFANSPAAPKPCKGPLHHPSSRKNHESFRRIAAFDNFDCPIAVAGNRLAQLRAGIGTIGKQVTQPGEPVANGLDERACAIAVLNVGRGKRSQTTAIRSCRQQCGACDP